MMRQWGKLGEILAKQHRQRINAEPRKEYEGSSPRREATPAISTTPPRSLLSKRVNSKCNKAMLPRRPSNRQHTTGLLCRIDHQQGQNGFPLNQRIGEALRPVWEHAAEQMGADYRKLMHGAEAGLIGQTKQ